MQAFVRPTIRSPASSAELAAALELAPKDARVKELAAAIAKQKAASR